MLAQLAGLAMGLALMLTTTLHTWIEPQRLAGAQQLSWRQGCLYFASQPYSGLLLDRYDNGSLAGAESFLNGKEHGLKIRWYPNYALAEARAYQYGTKQGWQRGWYPNGQARFRCQYDHDQYASDFWEWHPDGRPYRCRRFSANHEQGQVIWRRSGNVYANYVHQPQRLSGLLGGRLCVRTSP